MAAPESDAETQRSGVFRRRIAPILLAMAGLLVSVYLAACQFAWISAVWDPVFGPSSSSAVLHSVLERMLPVPDASLGAAAYLGEVALGMAVIVSARRLVHVIYAALAGAMAAVGLPRAAA